MSRWKAAALHLSISATIGLIAGVLILGVWYPPPYGQAAGATELVMLLLGVDVVLGPLLTLIVFRSGKRSLKFDLSVIALLQACALLYGMSVVMRARPVFIVAAVHRFVLVSANDLDVADLAEGSKPEFRSLPWTGPRLVFAQLPGDPKQRSDLLFSGMAGKDIEKFPRYYLEYASHAPQMLTHAKSLEALQKALPNATETINAWLSAQSRTTNDVVWLPLTGARATLTILLDSRSGEVLGTLPIDPW